MSFQDAKKINAAEVVQLLLSTAHYIQQEYEVHLAASDTSIRLSRPRVRLLIAVWNAETIRMNALAHMMGLKPRTITEHVDALERDGLIQRIADPDDRRATLLKLTEEAHSQVLQIKADQEQISEKLLTNLSPQQRSELIQLLTLFFDGKDIDFIC